MLLLVCGFRYNLAILLFIQPIAFVTLVLGRAKRIIISLLLFVTIAASFFVVYVRQYPVLGTVPNHLLPGFIASIDTMKESRDSETNQLTPAQIQDDVQKIAFLNVNYITVDTNWDYPDYMAEWVNAIRAAGKHIWFRTAPNQWEEINGVTGIMTPAALITSEKTFITTHPNLFKSGDIFDPCPEPEQGYYWARTYGRGWSNQPPAPNRATKEFNAFIRDTTDAANNAFHSVNISGVYTNIRSINSFFPTHPGTLEQATVSKLGVVTFDSYPELDTTDPAVATSRRINEIEQIEITWHVPIVVGEMGYSSIMNVDDFTQEAVLKAEFTALANLPYIAGVNYWVGPGYNYSIGNTYIMSKDVDGFWAYRPAAFDLSDYFRRERNR